VRTVADGIPDRPVRRLPLDHATLRYDFNVQTPTLRCFPLGADAIDFGVPSFTGEPEGVGGFYGYRSLRFTQRIIGTRAVALARMSTAGQGTVPGDELAAVPVGPSMTPVFFKTYRAEPGACRWRTRATRTPGTSSCR
jgi:hypothetical protein